VKTLETLRRLGGKSPRSPLADVASELVARVNAAEEQRMHEAHARQASLGGGAGPILSVLKKRLAEANAASLVNNAAPAITRADFHQLLREASSKEPKDRGLGRAATHAYRLWSKEATGALTVGDVARFRAHYHEEYPRSKVASVIDTEVPKLGFNVLPAAKLARIAAQIQRAGGDQAAYNEAMVQYGLDQQTAHAFRCRAFVRALVAASDEHEAEDEGHGEERMARRLKARLATDEDPILRRFAQFEEDDGMLEEADELHFDEEGNVGSEQTVDSPITGEPLHIELEEGSSEDVPEEDMTAGGPLPQGMEVMGQLEDFAPESVTVMEDPTDPDGGELEVTVRPLDDAGPMPEPDDAPVELSDEDMTIIGRRIARGMCGKCGGDHGMHEACASRTADDEREFTDDDIEAWEKSVEHYAGAQQYAVYASVNGEMGKKPIDSFPAVSMSAALKRIARHGVRGQLLGNPDRLGTECYVELQDGNHLLIRAAEQQPELKGKDEAFEPDVHDQQPDSLSVTDDILLGDKTMGKQHHPFAALADSVLDGRTAKRAGWELQVNGDADVVLTYQGKQKRKASLGELDEVVREFVDASAPPAPRQLHYAAHKHTASGEYLVVTDVPGDTEDQRHNAKRILHAIQKVIPSARGVLRKDAKLQLKFAAGEPELGRVRRILEDQYRAKEYRIAQVDMPPSPGSTANEGTAQLTPADPNQLVQNPPVPAGTVQQPAAPAAPAQQPAQPAPGGYVGPPQAAPAAQPQAAKTTNRAVEGSWLITFKDPSGNTAEAPVQARTAGVAKDLFERFNDDCEVVKVAQFMEVAPGEPIGGGEDVPLPVADMLDAESVPPDSGAPAPAPMGMDMGGSSLSPEENDALRAALTHYRNQGLGPMSALDQIASQYQDLLSHHGDKTDTQRHDIEAAIMAMVPEIWAQPALLDKAAQMQQVIPQVPEQIIEGKPLGFADMNEPQKSSVTLVYLDNPVQDDMQAKKKFMANMHRVMTMTSRLLGADLHVEGNVNSLVWELQGADADKVKEELQPYTSQGIRFQVKKRAQLTGNEPAVNTQQPDYVQVPADLGPDSETDDAASNAVEAPKVNQQVPAQSQPGTSDSVEAGAPLGSDSETKDPGSFGAPKPKAQPDQQPQQGESHASTEGPAAGLGADSETDPKIHKHMDDVAARASGATRSANARLDQLYELGERVTKSAGLKSSEELYANAEVQKFIRDHGIDKNAALDVVREVLPNDAD
jgi:hypothetical protein